VTLRQELEYGACGKESVTSYAQSEQRQHTIILQHYGIQTVASFQ
jgi:hypothetical protein